MARNAYFTCKSLLEVDRFLTFFPYDLSIAALRPWKGAGSGGFFLQKEAREAGNESSSAVDRPASAGSAEGIGEIHPVSLPFPAKKGSPTALTDRLGASHV